MQRTIRTRLHELFELDPTHPGRILPMEGLRGLAVLLVFLVHFRTLFAGWATPGSAGTAVFDVLGSVGHSGVDLFFVLSGYLIYGAVIRRPVSYAGFTRRRVQRIYPVFLVVLGVYLVLSVVQPSQSKLPASVPDDLLLVLGNVLLLPGMLQVTAIITVAWTLSYEFFYYLVAPLAVGWTGMRGWDPRRRVAVVAGLAVAGLVLSYTVDPDHVRLVMFLAGILVWELLNSFQVLRRVPRAVEWGVLVALPLVFLLVARVSGSPDEGFSPPGDSWTPVARVVVLCLAFGALTAVAFRSSGALHTVFGWTPLRWLGNMSYTFYLVHGLALNAFVLVLAKVVPEGARPDWFVLVLLVASFAAATVLSSLLFLAVEKPYSLQRPAHRGAHRASRMPSRWRSRSATADAGPQAAA